MIEVSGLGKSFRGQEGQVVAVDDVSFRVEAGDFFTLVGPSGCGKTTTLRMVAGLETPTTGQIRIGESIVFSDQARIHVPVHRRSIGMVFQSYAIWPHMTVFDNVAYPLQVQRLDRAEIRRRVGEALSMVDLEGLEKRPAPRLSGGQQQRVALARAMVVKPSVLLLDEPLSNLDANLRMQMREELKQLQSQIGITTIYVTHDQDEALSLSDKVAVMNRGKIVQSGDPVSVYSQPRSKFVATFIGAANLLSGKVDSESSTVEPAVARVLTAIGPMVCSRSGQVSNRDSVGVSIRPEVISMDVEPISGDNIFVGRVVHSSYLGHHVEYLILVGDTPLRVNGPPTRDIKEGATVYLCLPREHCVLIDTAD